MQLEGFFLATVNISVVLIGFVTVFLTFVMNGRETNRPDRMHSRSLLTSSYSLLLVPFVPIAAKAYGANEATALFAFHVAGFCAVLGTGAVMMWFFFRLTRAEMKQAGVIHNVVSFATGAAAAGFFLAGARGHAPAGNAVMAVVVMLLLSATALFSFAAQQMRLFEWRNP